MQMARAPEVPKSNPRYNVWDLASEQTFVAIPRLDNLRLQAVLLRHEPSLTCQTAARQPADMQCPALGQLNRSCTCTCKEPRAASIVASQTQHQRSGHIPGWCVVRSSHATRQDPCSQNENGVACMHHVFHLSNSVSPFCTVALKVVRKTFYLREKLCCSAMRCLGPDGTRMWASVPKPKLGTHNMACTCLRSGVVLYFLLSASPARAKSVYDSVYQETLSGLAWMQDLRRWVQQRV